MKEFKPTFLIIHHSAVSREDQKAQFYAVGRYHQEKWNMKSTLGYYHGYNWFMGTNGAITQTRAIGEETMAVIGHNKDSIHICVAGDFDYELPTQTQALELANFIQETKDIYPDIEVKFHRDLAENRNCPGILFTKKYYNTNILNKTMTIDIDDVNKNIEIQSLQKQLDGARELIKQLLAFITNYLK